ncbi:MAG: sporulation transcription factor Spo0A [Clostridia bacterium]
MRKSIVIADDNANLTGSLKEFFGAQTDFEVVGIAENGVKALELVERYAPDFLLLDIVMPELDGFGVLSALTNKKPTVIMMSQLATDGFVQKAMQYGASYFLAKPFSYDVMLKVMSNINSVPTPQTAQAVQTAQTTKRNHSLDEKIANLFISVGIPAHIKGYQFLREAIKLTVDSPDIINAITKRLYPSIADHYQTSASKVERAIRHAIEVAWSRGKIENINNIFGIKIYSPNEKPTNGEFIALVADKLLLESA